MSSHREGQRVKRDSEIGMLRELFLQLGLTEEGMEDQDTFPPKFLQDKKRQARPPFHATHLPSLRSASGNLYVS